MKDRRKIKFHSKLDFRLFSLIDHLLTYLKELLIKLLFHTRLLNLSYLEKNLICFWNV